jgi:hypothetical protein
MDTTDELRVALTKHFLRKEGLVYCRADGTILAEVKKHHPYITKQVNEIVLIVREVAG